jgi:hypothetical protein
MFAYAMLQVYRLVTFLKFMHRPMQPVDFNRQPPVVALRGLGKALVPDTRSKEPKATTFSNVPVYADLLRGVIEYCDNKAKQPRGLREVCFRVTPRKLPA